MDSEKDIIDALKQLVYVAVYFPDELGKEHYAVKEAVEVLNRRGVECIL